MAPALRGETLARFAAGAALAIAATGCATQADLQYLQGDVREARTQAADAQAIAQSVKHDLEAVRGEFEQLKYQANAGGKSEDLMRRLEALDARLAALEAARGGVPTASSAAGGAPAAEPTPAAANPAQSEPIPADAPPDFRDAMQLLRSGDAQSAIQKLRDFLRKSPRSDYADDAQYWIGEAYFGIRDYNRAILEFNEVLLRYPKGDKVPAALLRQALAFAALGDKVDARLVLQKLVSEHSGTPEAEQGRQKLAELTS